MSQLCIIGSAEDQTTAAVVSAAIEAGVACSLVDLDEFLLAGWLSFDSDAPSRARVGVGEVELELGEYSGIYARLSVPKFRGIGRHDSRKLTSLLAALRVALMGVPVRVMNGPLGGWENMSKLAQLRILKGAGFDVPPSMVTMRPSDLSRFYHARSPAIYKSASAQRSIVETLTSDHLSRAAAVEHCPVLLQPAIPGIDVRVHVVGSEVFAVGIASDRIDYRYAAASGGYCHLSRYEDLPVSLAARCVAFAAERGLYLAGFDFKCTDAGEYYCLEMNPMPAFVFFESCLGGAISGAVVSMLTRVNDDDVPSADGGERGLLSI